MRTTAVLATALAFLTMAALPAFAQEGGWGSFSFGLRTGFSKLEGDLEHPRLCPTVGGRLEYAPVPYFGFGVAASYAILNSREYQEREALRWDKSIAAPVEGELLFRLFPLHRVCPYASIGAGALYWRSTRVTTGTIRKGWDGSVKVGGGLDLRVSPGVSLCLGADVRATFVDALDNRESGDETDGVIFAHAGLSFSFPTRDENDRDRDGVPRELDLDDAVAEDQDGYLDHDGVPEENPDFVRYYHGKMKLMEEIQEIARQEALPEKKPILIHHPVRRAEAHRSLKLNAEVFCDSLFTCAALYRVGAEAGWSVVKMVPHPALPYRYVATIPDSSVERGLMYFVAAVNAGKSGIGYSGLPRRPLQVKVFTNASRWRRVGGTVAALGWGAAGFWVLRRQK